MEKQIWYFEEIDLYTILCPYKMDKHIRQHPYSKYDKNDFIFLPNETATDIYLIAEGRVKVGYYDDEGNEVVLAYLRKGEILGETAYLGRTSRREFAQVASSNTMICKMSADKARALSRDYVPFALEMNKKIADRILFLERRLEIMFYKDVRRRLIELLKDLAEMYPAANGHKWVEHGLTQQEMAGLIGTSRKSVSLLLNELEKEGKLLLGAGKFKLLNSSPQELAA